MSEKELHYLLTLQRIPNIGSITAKKLLSKVGSAEAVFKSKKETLLTIDGVGNFKLKELGNYVYFEEAAQELEFIKKENITVKYFEDADYPSNLKHCIDAPILLFQRGNIDFKQDRIISIVGTRKATNQGISFCEELIEMLAPLNPVIVSGLAYGIDICAHKAAIKHELQTIACLAHGLNQIYPKSHYKYQPSIEKNGGLITDFWSDAKFDRKNFLKRNRIIAGLSQATIVIESGEKGGSLVTADIANSYNREVFAVPGRPTDSQSKGCNTLIKTQQAHLLTNAADIIYMLNWELDKTKKTQQEKLFLTLSPEEENILSLMKKFEKVEIDTLSLQAKMPTYKVATILLNLELQGLIRPLPGKAYEII